MNSFPRLSKFKVVAHWLLQCIMGLNECNH